MKTLMSLFKPLMFSIVTFIIFYNFMVGEKGLEPSHLSILVPKTSASTNSAIRPQTCWVLYIIDVICPMTIIIKYINNHLIC